MKVMVIIMRNSEYRKRKVTYCRDGDRKEGDCCDREKEIIGRM